MQEIYSNNDDQLEFFQNWDSNHESTWAPRDKMPKVEGLEHLLIAVWQCHTDSNNNKT